MSCLSSLDNVIVDRIGLNFTRKRNTGRNLTSPRAPDHQNKVHSPVIVRCLPSLVITQFLTEKVEESEKAKNTVPEPSPLPLSTLILMPGA